MRQDKRIPQSWPVRWRRIRRQGIPIVCFVLSVAASEWLWNQQRGAVHSIGEVNAARIDVASPTSGVVIAFPDVNRNWQVYDHVQAGDLLAVVESSHSQAPTQTDGNGANENGARSADVRAPITGTLVAIYCAPGQAVPQGGLIASIASDEPRYILSYLPENSRIVAEPGMPVSVQTRSVGSRQFKTKIQTVGRQIELVPPHQMDNPATPQWGLPVRIQLPEDADLRPGALVDVDFTDTRQM
jgi:multidrug resistance efflux pump